MTDHDFTTNTTAELRMLTRVDFVHPIRDEVLAELARREQDGTLDDGSEARWAELVARNKIRVRTTRTQEGR